ncbi:multiubiquitin domain-containing protein [Sphingomonas bacterium]|uniref:multiubiquitin domain-containing protein n=1 Tax=Sphingomonas bacterium TaxID=1895847 RepID=UPI001575E58F|nr:multiubiquitin domain-containing protein [Sphingomonas bacterium]
MLTTITPAAAPTVPALLPHVPPRRRALYLVGEAERSTPRPVATADRTTISVNGRWIALRGRTATYAQLLRIAYPDREGQNPGAATVSFRHSVDTGLNGLLMPGDVVPLADGLLVNVNATFAS